MSGNRVPVRWRDLDPLGHVNAAIFLTYLEEGRNVWLQHVLGEEFGPEQWVLVHAEIDFRAEIARWLKQVETDHELASIGRSSITLAERLSDDEGTVLADARVVLALWDPELRRARPLTDTERDALAALPSVP